MTMHIHLTILRDFLTYGGLKGADLWLVYWILLQGSKIIGTATFNFSYAYIVDEDRAFFFLVTVSILYYKPFFSDGHCRIDAGHPYGWD